MGWIHKGVKLSIGGLDLDFFHTLAQMENTLSMNVWLYGTRIALMEGKFPIHALLEHMSITFAEVTYVLHPISLRVVRRR